MKLNIDETEGKAMRTNEYEGLNEHTFDLGTSRVLSRKAPDHRLKVSNSEFMLQGKVYSLPYSPVSKKTAQNFLYLQHYAIMDMNEAFYTRRRNYDSYLILYTLSGKGELIYRGQNWLLETGYGFLIDCEEEHAYHSNGTNWKHLVIHFNGGNAQFYYNEYFKEGAPLFHVTNIPYFQSLIDNVANHARSAKKYHDLYTFISLQQVLALIAENRASNVSSNETSDNIQYLCKYLEYHFTEDITLEDMAAFCGLNASYLCRAFKKQTSFSPKEYVTLLRLNRAKNLLSNTDIPAYKIGELVGISNEANFIRLFKKYEHMSPGEYRKQIK